MKHLSNILLLLCSLLYVAAIANSASFDCTKAASDVEKIICADAELLKMDDDLDTAYHAAIRTSNNKDEIIRDQRRWLRKRNMCRDKYCIKSAYETRLINFQTNQPLEPPAKEGPPWIFSLTQGGDLPVCQTYLKRLNHGQQANYPFCDRPETGDNYGFTLLSRKPLTDNQLHELGNRANGFMSIRNQDATDLNNAWRKKLKLAPVDWMTFEDISNYVGKDIFVWQYDPPIDIDNDGQSDRIVVWRGYPLGASGLPGCGWMDKYGHIWSGTQMPFFVDPALTRIDAGKTIEVFGHPLGCYKIYEGTKKEMCVDEFRPIGQTIGIFKYEGVYYFDTFFDGWGDFRGARRDDPNISSILGVFVRRNGETKQVCEYFWENNPNNRPVSSGR